MNRAVVLGLIRSFIIAFVAIGGYEAITETDLGIIDGFLVGMTGIGFREILFLGVSHD